MIRSSISRGKSACLGCFKAFKNIIFPPYCIACKEPSDTKWFCSVCWLECQPLDPEQRCPHCFHESGGLCSSCKRDPKIPFPQKFVFETNHLTPYLKQMEKKTLASFAIRAYLSYDIPIPDLIVPMAGNKEYARYFSEMIQVPLANYRGIEEKKVLLVLNEDCSLEECKEQIRLLKEFSPKKGYLFHLFGVG